MSTRRALINSCSEMLCITSPNTCGSHQDPRSSLQLLQCTRQQWLTPHVQYPTQLPCSCWQLHLLPAFLGASLGSYHFAAAWSHDASQLLCIPLALFELQSLHKSSNHQCQGLPLSMYFYKGPAWLA